MTINPYQQIYANSFRTSSHQFGEIPPLWTIDFADDEAVLKWFSQAIDALKEDHRERSYIQLRNRDFYASLQSPSLGRTGIPRDREGKEVTSTTSRIVVNKIYNMIELWVSKLTRFAPAVSVSPTNNEYSDKVSAELGKLIIDNIFYTHDIDELLELLVRCSRIFGEMYLFVEWDKTKGDYVLPKDERALLNSDMGMQVYGEEGTSEVTRQEVVSSDGTPVETVEGNTMMVDPSMRTGDVVINPVYPWFVWEEPRTFFKEVDWTIKQSTAYIDELRAKYPDKADDIQAGTYGELEIPYTDLANNEVPVFEIYHRSTEFLDSGRYIKLTPTCVLENKPLPYSHGQIPRVRLTNIDVPGELRGTSLLNNVLLLQVMLNNLYSLAYTNLSLGAHAYWLIPTQANISKDKIRNSATVLSYTAPYTPKLEVFRTVGGEVFQMIGDVDARITEISGHQGLSQGDPPPGVDAALALGVLEEQEQQRANSDIKKYNAFIRKLAKLCLATAQDNYKQEDGRLLRIVGKNGQDRIKALDMAKFAGPYDVRVQRSTALSESKSARLQQLMLLKQNWPTSISDSRMLELMELADESKFYDLTTAAVRAAEAENERFFAGEEVKEPVQYENHFNHWEVHFQFMQSLSFKEDVPPEFQERLFDHLLVHEAKMFEAATKSITFAQKLIAIEQYPSFYLLPMPLTQVVQMLGQGVDPATMMMGGAPALPPPPMGAPPPPSSEAPPEGSEPGPMEDAEQQGEAEPDGMPISKGKAALDLNLNISGGGKSPSRIIFSTDEEGNRIASAVDAEGNKVKSAKIKGNGPDKVVEIQ